MNPVKVVQPVGIIDGTQVDQLHQQIDAAIDAGASIIVVDLQDVSFMDSSGLGALVIALKKVRAIGKRLCICSLNQQLQILFEVASMDLIFEIYKNQDEFQETLLAIAAS
jgi:anti-anti-sigma factor